MGRVGRQGDPGSSVFIVTEKEIEDKLGMSATNWKNKSPQAIQQEIDIAREGKMQERQ